MKRDINFIKHIKPQLKERERSDKSESRQKQYENACRRIGIEPKPEAIGIEEIGILTSLFRRVKE